MDPEGQTTSELDRALATTRTAEGIHAVTITDDWNTPNGTANGGYVLGLVLRAIAQESPLHDPLTVSISYFRPPAVGDATVDVTALRIGKRVATFEAVLTQDHKPVVHAVASFHDADATGDLEHLSPAPDYPRPDDCIDVMSAVPMGTVPILDRFDYRHESVPGWMAEEPSGDTSATFWVRFKDGRPVDAIAAAVLVDAYPPVTAEIGQLKSATVQMTVHFRRRPVTGWVLAHVATRHVIDGYHDEDVELWDEDGRLIAQSRQLAILR
ncbi:acyl-CoA thioesterase [Aeromicrobium sp.]|uniref:acyl-CoA thioesterase n=1 Tax=Aeromicrobium sp. TaxID=1871063 RepID=UPI003C4B7239